jgi:hypothetical protein
VILLGAPFYQNHRRPKNDIQYRDVNDPHYWKAEYHCPVHGQSVACQCAAIVR